MLTSELRYGDLWSMREFNHFDFELNGIIRAFLRTTVNDFMDSVHHIWCPLSSQEYQDLPDGAETTLTLIRQVEGDLSQFCGSPPWQPARINTFLAVTGSETKFEGNLSQYMRAVCRS